MNLFHIENFVKNVVEQQIHKLPKIMLPLLYAFDCQRSMDIFSAVLTKHANDEKVKHMFTLCKTRFQLDCFEMVNGKELWGFSYQNNDGHGILVAHIFDAYTFGYIETRVYGLDTDKVNVWIWSIHFDELKNNLWIICISDHWKSDLYVCINTETNTYFVDQNPDNVNEAKIVEDLCVTGMDRLYKWVKMNEKPTQDGPFIEFHRRCVMNATIFKKYLDLVNLIKTKDVHIEDYIGGRFMFNKDISVLILRLYMPDYINNSKHMCAIIAGDEVRFVYPQNYEYCDDLKLMRRADGAVLFYSQANHIIDVYR